MLKHFKVTQSTKILAHPIFTNKKKKKWGVSHIWHVVSLVAHELNKLN